MRCIFTGAVRLLIAVLLSSQPASTFAQDAENTKNFTSYRGAQYYLGDEDELLMKVNIWGFVRKPGQYMIPPNTDLISLMSFAGGPIEQAKIKSIKIVRSKTQQQSSYITNGRISGPAMKNGSDSLTNGVSKTEHEHQKVYTVNVKKYLSTGQDNLLPPLKPGDTVVVEATTFNTIKQVLDFTARIAILGQLYFWVTR